MAEPLPPNDPFQRGYVGHYVQERQPLTGENMFTPVHKTIWYRDPDTIVITDVKKNIKTGRLKRVGPLKVYHLPPPFIDRGWSKVDYMNYSGVYKTRQDLHYSK